MRPGRARHEQHRSDCCAVHERTAEVGLQEHEEDRDRSEADRSGGGPNLAQPSRALRQESGQREDEQHLPELGRLEAEEAEVEPALRAADRPCEQHERDDGGRASEDQAPPRPIDLRIDDQGHDQPDGADQREDDLSGQVIPRVPGDVVVRDYLDRPEAVPDHGADRADEDPVQAPHERRDVGRFAPARAGCGPGVGDVVVDHQRIT